MPIRSSRRQPYVEGIPSDERLESILHEWVRSRPDLSDAPYAEIFHLPRETGGAILVSIAQLPESIGVKFRDALRRALGPTTNPTRVALMIRGLEAIARMGGALDEAESAAVLANPTDQDVLLDLIERAPRTRATATENLLDEARVRGARMREQVLAAEGGGWSAVQVGQHLHISRQAVDRRRASGNLLALPIGAKSYLYPRWQFTDDGVLPGVADVLKAFSLPGTWTRAAFFVSPNSYLAGSRPLDELRRGNVDAVTRAATRFGEQGAA